MEYWKRWQGGRRLGVALVATLVTALSVLPGSAGSQPRRASQPQPFNYCADAGAVFKQRQSFIGMNDYYVETGSESYRNCSLGRMSAAGIGYFRAEIDWADVQLEPNQPDDCGVYDYLVADVARHHMHMLGLLMGSPTWLSTDPQADGINGVYPPKDPAQFAQFATTCVKRFGPGGAFWRQNPTVPYYPVRAWQIWNEPEFAYAWAPKPNMRAYVRLLRTASVAIRRVDRHAIVVAAGMAFVNDAAEIHYMSNLYRYGARGAFNAFALHDYSLTVSQAIQRLWLARRLMNRFGDRHTALWITEFGWAGGGRDSFITNWRRQARNIRAFFKLVQKERRPLRLGEVMWYGWRDSQPSDGATDSGYWGYNLGVFTSDLSPKPGFVALSAAARRLDR